MFQFAAFQIVTKTHCTEAPSNKTTRNKNQKQNNIQRNFFIHIIFCTLFASFIFNLLLVFLFFLLFSILFGEYILLKLMENMCENFSAVDFLFGCCCCLKWIPWYFFVILFIFFCAACLAANLRTKYQKSRNYLLLEFLVV